MIEYIPIIGFIVTGVRCVWAQHQCLAGRMPFDVEAVYFERFTTAYFCTAGSVLLAMAVLFILKDMLGRTGETQK